LGKVKGIAVNQRLRHKRAASVPAHFTRLHPTGMESALSERGASAAKTLAALKALDFTHVLMIPDSESRLLYQAIGGDPDLHLITPCREGESIAIEVEKIVNL